MVVQIVVVVIVAAWLHRNSAGPRGGNRVATAAFQIFVVLIVQRQRSVKVELSLQIVCFSLQIGQDAIHLFQHFRIDPIGCGQLLSRVTGGGRIRVIRAKRDVVDFVLFLLVLVPFIHQRDTAVVGAARVGCHPSTTAATSAVK